MSAGFDWCIQRAQSPETSTYYDRDWTKAEERDSAELFEKVLETYNPPTNGKREIIIPAYKDIAPEIHISLSFDDSADKDYFASSSSIHDGTALFFLQHYEHLILKVLRGDTYFTPKGPPKQNIHYSIGNFVILNELGDFGGAEKPWMHSRTTMLLPLKYETW